MFFTGHTVSVCPSTCLDVYKSVGQLARLCSSVDHYENTCLQQRMSQSVVSGGRCTYHSPSAEPDARNPTQPSSRRRTQARGTTTNSMKRSDRSSLYCYHVLYVYVKKKNLNHILNSVQYYSSLLFHTDFSPQHQRSMIIKRRQ